MPKKSPTEEAILLIDEINERSSSRQFYGIGHSLHAKLCTIRATLLRSIMPDIPFTDLSGNPAGAIPAPVAADLADLNARNAKMQRRLAAIVELAKDGLTADAETVGDIAEEFDKADLVTRVNAAVLAGGAADIDLRRAVFVDGKTAAMAGLAVTCCHLPPGTIYYDDWHDGFAEGAA